jgi:SnoaL-like domain
MQKTQSAKNAKEIVIEYLETLTEHPDFESARSYLKDDMSYVSPLNSFNNADAYLKYSLSLHLPKLDIKKIVTDGDDVCILHETTLTRPSATVPASLWFHVDGGKISSLSVLFDPRPFLQAQRDR